MDFLQDDVRDVDLTCLVFELWLQLEKTLFDFLLDVGGQLFLRADELRVERMEETLHICPVFLWPRTQSGDAAVRHTLIGVIFL